jgi:cobalt/nickel transport system permease protein
VGSGHSSHLHVEGDTPLHRLPAHVKLVGLLVFVLATVSVPNEARGVLVVLLAAAVLVLLSTRVPARHLLPRLAVETPFAVFAVVLPFVAVGPEVDLGVVSVSQPGLVAAAALLLKGTTGVVSAVAFAVTTPPRDLVRALQHLRVPDPLVTIASFMVRYVEVVTDQLRRMRVARESRGFRARSVRAWPALASSTGALFIRSYERGERVHLAMLSRGYRGRMPVTDPLAGTAGQWAAALVPAAVATAGSVLVRVT